MLIEPGTVFAERWVIDEPLASGSTSEVFRGHERASGEPAAIKVLLPEFADDAQALQRFQREARVAQRLAHPNIVAVRDFGVDRGHPWLAMELLEGETLELRLQREHLAPALVLDVIDQIAAAVDHAHGLGVVHRDLKPDNCFLVAGADPLRVKVLDFGFAKLLDALESDGLKTASNAVLGTPLYMAPEQVRSSATVDPRADLWSLGVVAYELLVGDAPFPGRSAADLFVQILSRPVDAPSARNAALPVPLDRWAARALDRDPARRFASAAELARALRAAMDPRFAHHAAAVTAPHAAVNAKPPARNAKAPARAFAVAALVALAVATVVALAVAWAR
ncbi:MAG: serine/threonine-protein kinase [Polyangiales bacterium]